MKKFILLLVLLFTMQMMIGCEDGDITLPEDPINETPVDEDPVDEEPVDEEPVDEEPVDEEPVDEEPVDEEPVDEEPVDEEPVDEEPVDEDPVDEEPTDEDLYYENYLDLLDVHGMADGEQIEVSGVVYFLTQNGYYIQDNTYNLFIFTDDTPTVDLGERVVVSGELTTYRQVKQIKNPTIVEINASDLSINQDVLPFEYGVTDLLPGHIYQVTGEVSVEGNYNTIYLNDNNQKIAEIYYRSITHSISAIEAYEGEIITLDLLYYAMGDEVERYAFQGSDAHITLYIPDQSVALEADANALPLEKELYGSYDFGEGFYGSTYEVINVTGDISAYITYQQSSLQVTRPTEAEGDQVGVITISVSLGEEEPIIKTIEIIIKAQGSSTVDMSYYSSTVGLTGDDLYDELHDIISTGVGSRSYDYAKVILEESDRDPNNPNNVILVYTRESVKGEWDYPNWNREHVWPQSKLNGASKGDAHNLKPSDVQENSRRGNLPFGYSSSSGVYEPHDDVKGDIARIVFYMATMYTQLSINSGTIGNLNTLLEWHYMDPVDDFERNRNDVIYAYQGNRNPYIDYPQFVDEIWGTNTSTSQNDQNQLSFSSFLNEQEGLFIQMF